MPTIAPSSMPSGVIVYGPMGCGKTRNAAALAKLFCKSRVIDDWKPGMMLPNDALALTCQFVDGAIAFDIALRALPEVLTTKRPCKKAITATQLLHAIDVAVNHAMKQGTDNYPAANRFIAFLAGTISVDDDALGDKIFSVLGLPTESAAK
jgi:hypothetical protein